ncbi:MAG: 2-succinyl-5-enolpyruvyl-6-hydroxy-3-cyclohexene-1-carboxylic-acid synthase, partial [Muribaculaceae bacterium]|nr:2-succinyl-5-enolpyruvyl-6-hydroxy-3-cyclohexene-1-carboxylic-acid synthase [Muribaculaceae bacterium]
QSTHQPVALIWTSGAAVRNFAPAVAEAYYQQLPLIVVSADRPAEWIDQDDSQTLRQFGVLSNITKRSYNLIAEPHNDTQKWWINRELNDAMIVATTAPCGPVHINMSIDAPIGTIEDVNIAEQHRRIECLLPRPSLTTSEARWLATDLASPRKVLIIAGFGAPNHKIDSALTRLAKCSNVVVLTESIANIHAQGVIERIDTTLSAMSCDEMSTLTPDVVITFGGALVSRMVKEFLRRAPSTMEHWQVGIKDTTVDCFQHLTRRIAIDPDEFLSQLATVMTRGKGQSTYSQEWAGIYERALESHERFIDNQCWCDLTAMASIFSLIPRQWNIQLSNGTPIRYAQLMAKSVPHRTINCNRGVSGIDGCTSTAVGASTTFTGITLLISGDTSFQYDLGALTLEQMSPRMKMIVMCNGGGAIFHFIDATRHLPETSSYISPSVNLPLPQLCEAFGISYHQAGNMKELESSLKKFAAVDDRPALLAVYTDGNLSAEVLRNYFRR